MAAPAVMAQQHAPGGYQNSSVPRFFHMPRFQAPPQLQSKPFINLKGTNHHYQTHNQMSATQQGTFDGKRMRRAVYRKTVDYNCSVINYIENRVWQRDERDQRSLITDQLYARQIVPPPAMKHQPMNCVATKFIRTSSNKIKCPIFAVCWTPEGRRLITGASSGEFTLWNGLTFNFETILQAHETSVRAMKWSHNDSWMLTGDHSGYIKYWQSNMNNVQMFLAHKEAIRGLSFCPTDQKFVSCSDDGTVRIWDFLRCHEEKILRGHGADVKCVDWNPLKALIVSGSKDTQQPLKLWDPRTGSSLATIHAHKHTVMDVEWNKNGNWLLTASRDHLVKLFDIRKMKEEIQTFKGHKKEAMAVAWHPINETLFASGGSDGSIMYWIAGQDKEVGAMDEAHDTIIWSLAWHPMGHILASGSNDHSTKFWTRNRPGDHMRDRYNLNTLPFGMSDDMADMADFDSLSNIPGMGLGDKQQIEDDSDTPTSPIIVNNSSTSAIPGLGMSDEQDKKQPMKKIPYAKPISRSFEAAWSTGLGGSSDSSRGMRHSGPRPGGPRPSLMPMGPHGQPLRPGMSPRMGPPRSEGPRPDGHHPEGHLNPRFGRPPRGRGVPVRGGRMPNPNGIPPSHRPPHDDEYNQGYEGQDSTNGDWYHEQPSEDADYGEYPAEGNHDQHYEEPYDKEGYQRDEQYPPRRPPPVKRAWEEDPEAQSWHEGEGDYGPSQSGGPRGAHHPSSRGGPGYRGHGLPPRGRAGPPPPRGGRGGLRPPILGGRPERPLHDSRGGLRGRGHGLEDRGGPRSRGHGPSWHPRGYV